MFEELCFQVLTMKNINIYAHKVNFVITPMLNGSFTNDVILLKWRLGFCDNYKRVKTYHIEKRVSQISKYVWHATQLKPKHLGSISPTCLRAAFTHAQSKKVDRLFFDWYLDCLFALSGPARVKAARKHVGEIDPWFSCFICDVIYFRMISGSNPATV